MYIYSTEAEIASAAPPLPPAVVPAFERRRRHTRDAGLGGMTALIVVTAKPVYNFRSDGRRLDRGRCLRRAEEACGGRHF